MDNTQMEAHQPHQLSMDSLDTVIITFLKTQRIENLSLSTIFFSTAL